MNIIKINRLILEKVFRFASYPIKRLSSFLALHVMYFVGIGMVSVVARVLGKRFLRNRNTGWNNVSINDNEFNRMY